MVFITYDSRVDALYVRLRRAAPSQRLKTKRFADGLRALDVTPDGAPSGVEFLSPRREGVNLEDVPMADEIADALDALSSLRVHRAGDASSP
jgi:hypothetical protein